MKPDSKPDQPLNDRPDPSTPSPSVKLKKGEPYMEGDLKITPLLGPWPIMEREHAQMKAKGIKPPTR